MQSHSKKLLIYWLLLFLCTCVNINAEENIEHFLLPETPPTIERLKKLPLDRPILKKQNYISEADITAPPVLMALNFSPFFEQEYPVQVGVFNGSFSSLGGSLLLSSKKGWQIAYQNGYSEGEIPKLAKEINEFRYSLDNSAASSLDVNSTIGSKENTIWNQRHNHYFFQSNWNWYARSNLNVKAKIFVSESEIKGMESNKSFDGTASLFWQLFPANNLFLSLSSQNDTAFAGEPGFFSAGLMYKAIFPLGFAMGGGCRFQRDKLFPQADLTWQFQPRLSVKISYQSGMDKPDWEKLYLSERYEKTSPDLLIPESGLHLRENISYYWTEKNSVDIEFEQGSWTNYVYWAEVPGSDFISPSNLKESYAAKIKLSVTQKGKLVSSTLSIARNSNYNVPFVPEWTLGGKLNLSLSTWILTAGYEYSSSRHVSFGDSKELLSFGNLSLTLRKTIVSGIEAFISGENLLKEKIETQPGFVQNSTILESGLTMKF